MRTITGPEEHEGAVYWNCNIVRLDGCTYVLSHRAILTLVVSAACNAACKFCSNEVTFTPPGPFLRYDERLGKVRDFALAGGVRKIAYTGGEPTANPQRLYDLFARMTPGFDRSRLHTNGFGLFRPVESEGGEALLLDSLIHAGLTGVSISVAHHDPDVNRTVMRFKGAWQGMSDDDLRQVAARACGTFQPRLSCVFTHESVRTLDDVVEYLEWGRSLGFHRFIFRSCSQIPEEFQKSTEFSHFNSANYLSIDPIVDELDRRPGFERTFRQRKSDSRVDTYRWRDVSFDIDEASEEADPDLKIRRLIVMANGMAYTSWIDPLSVLFEEDRPAAAAAQQREFALA